jgi:hypothetical protein
MKSILVILFGIIIHYGNVNAQSLKDERFKVMVESTRKYIETEDEFLHYGVYSTADTIFSSFALRKIKTTRKKTNRLTSQLVSILKDKYFGKYERESSTQKICGYYIETNPVLFDSYAAFIKKINSTVNQLTRVLASDQDLINIKIYTGTDEFIVVNEFFRYNGAFQPKTIDDLRLKRNITSLCVLCWSDDVFYGNAVKDVSKSKFGFSESRFLIQIACPVINDHKYLCDVLFTYLK